jgi:2-polyprenyl-6-hydroxyphenyl methylase/3-demethylubiquinone-9 3-methyltransferase
MMAVDPRGVTVAAMEEATNTFVIAHADEVARGGRFEFGANWARFLAVLDDARIVEAERSLREMLEIERLDGRSFLDIGCGSGLFSLAALRLGAERVHSFDFDPASVACASELRRRYATSGAHWTIEPGSALDRGYLESLGDFDIVYSWGVLHHTGAMWEAIDNATIPVASGGVLFISIYNDQGLPTHIWTQVKRGYSSVPRQLRTPYVVAVMAPREALSFVASAARGRPQDYVRRWREYRRRRGMSRWHDLVDWVGGYPFEVASPEAVFHFLRERGFTLRRLKTCGGGLGCNQFVMVRELG